MRAKPSGSGRKSVIGRSSAWGFSSVSTVSLRGPLNLVNLNLTRFANLAAKRAGDRRIRALIGQRPPTTESLRVMQSRCAFHSKLANPAHTTFFSNFTWSSPRFFSALPSSFLPAEWVLPQYGWWMEDLQRPDPTHPSGHPDQSPFA